MFEKIKNELTNYENQYTAKKEEHEAFVKRAHENFVGGMLTAKIGEEKAKYDAELEELKEKTKQVIENEIATITGKIRKISQEPVSGDVEAVLRMLDRIDKLSDREKDDIISMCSGNYYACRALKKLTEGEAVVLSLDDVLDGVEEAKGLVRDCLNGRYEMGEYNYTNIARGSRLDGIDELVTAFTERQFIVKAGEQEN